MPIGVMDDPDYLNRNRVCCKLSLAEALERSEGEATEESTLAVAAAGGSCESRHSGGASVGASSCLWILRVDSSLPLRFAHGFGSE